MVLGIRLDNGVYLFKSGRWTFQILHEVLMGVEQYTGHTFLAVARPRPLKQVLQFFCRERVGRSRHVDKSLKFLHGNLYLLVFSNVNGIPSHASEDECPQADAAIGAILAQSSRITG